MGLDIGERRVGVAVSDELHVIASPVESVDLKRGGVDALLAAIERHSPERIIVGLPTSMSGREGPQAKAVREFAKQLGEAVQTPITFWDERLTTSIAEQALITSGRRRRERKERVDAVAAALILQSYLDSRRR
ncbi:Holliday junction resolvase RuvX [Nitrolancea hollandica]|uniref:Putative pre-16S rRNA nuclease n=1 Tax=Nitrolancea hollandica Lb TaxID=1129897 RepID=I4ECC1_9BACT|nr:Holliday junction resolvase RuvX [Nitrolancea hollandica]CCF82333.1 putative Holliday junction resolvase [Nitrolancea hollandica Lb]